MKPILVAPIIFLVLAGGAHAAGYVMDLGETTFTGQQLVPDHPSTGVDGWTQSEANNESIRPKAWINPVGTSTGIAFGPYYDDLDGPFSIKRDVSLGLDGGSLALTVQLADSSFLPNRDNFFIRLNDTSGNDLHTLNFVPNTSVVDPESMGSWNVSSNDVPPFTSPFTSVSDNAIYDISISFSEVIPDYYSYDVSVTDRAALPNTFSVTGYFDNQAGEIGSLELGVTTGFLNIGYGDNYMSVTDVSLIPEPSTSLLSALAMSGLLVRRKRA